MTATERRTAIEPKYYVWSFPGCPLKVHLDLKLVERLQKQPRHATDVSSISQGLLLGRTLGTVVEINDFQPLPSAETKDIEQAIAALADEGGQQLLMGYYRFQHGGVLRLSDHDLTLAEASFTEAKHVFLLIQTADSGPATGSFFFREGGRMNGDFAFLEFPFDAALLAATERNKVETAMRKAQERPLVVEVAPPSAPVPAPTGPGRSVVGTGSRAALIVAAVVLAALASVRLLRDRLPQTPAPASAVSSLPSSVGLRAERQGSDLRLTWNREAAVVRAATSGLLSIRDGQFTRQIPLDPTQLRGGSILYAPTSDQLQLQLSVLDAVNTTTESVMVIIPKVGSPAVQVMRGQNGSGATQRRSPESRSALADPVQFQLPKSPAPSAGNQAVRSPSSPVIDEPPTLKPGDLTTKPGDLTTAKVLDAPLPAPRPPASKPATSIPEQQTTAPPAVFTANSHAYQPPVAINQVMPGVPPELKLLVTKPKTVEVRITIDAGGKVVKAEPVPGQDLHKLLIDAALNAARRWQFRPARSNDQAITSEMLLQFNFKPRSNSNMF
jgi:TonB-like protein